ncbi:hypothetical protein FKW77_002624 [Venturia effusa]|uniref:Uncharacterized protein n=1 Tax=Venturia effusa TaxID=50376 RepID=A0A517LAL3_9PEZI|nr:hypothetical protein FKW77_002624 [Venturia effusa]
MASPSTFETVNQKLVDVTKEIGLLEQDNYHLRLYIRPDPTKLDTMRSKMDELSSQFLELQPALELLRSSDLGRVLVSLVEEQQEKLARETFVTGYIRDGQHKSETADYRVSKLVEKFSSIGLAVKELEDQTTSNATGPQPLIQIFEERQEQARTKLRLLVDDLKLPEYSDLFDEFNRAILNLWDIAHAIDRRLSKLTGKPVWQPPPSRPNDGNTEGYINDTIGIPLLRESILRSADEKILAKTILIYVDAIEARARILCGLKLEVDQKWDEQYQAGVQLDSFRKHLERYQERLDQGQAELVALSESFGNAILNAEKQVPQIQHLKAELSKIQNLAAGSANTDQPDEILDPAREHSYQPTPISYGLQRQADSLVLLQYQIEMTAARNPEDIRDQMFTHLASFRNLAAAIEARDGVFFTRWLTETRDNDRRKHDVEERNNELDTREKKLDKRKEELDQRQKRMENSEICLNEYIDKMNALSTKDESAMRAREVAVSRREAAPMSGCQIL